MKTKAILVMVLVALFVITPSVFAGAAEVWYSDKDVGQLIRRTTFDGTILPSIATGAINVKNLTIIGDEVWFSGNGSWLGRLDFDGTRLSNFQTGRSIIGDFALVDDEIWVASAGTSSWIERWTLDHVELPRLLIPNVDVGGICVVGNEVWYSDKDVDGLIYRTTPDGTMLPSISTGESNVKNLKVIGDEVWFIGVNASWIGRLDFDGTRLSGDFQTHQPIGDYALVGDQIWCSDADTGSWIERWTLDHSELTGFNVPGDAGGILVVPEPITLSLLAIGGLAMLRRKSKG